MQGQRRALENVDDPARGMAIAERRDGANHLLTLGLVQQEARRGLEHGVALDPDEAGDAGR